MCLIFLFHSKRKPKQRQVNKRVLNYTCVRRGEHQQALTLQFSEDLFLSSPSLEFVCDSHRRVAIARLRNHYNITGAVLFSSFSTGASATTKKKHICHISLSRSAFCSPSWQQCVFKCSFYCAVARAFHSQGALLISRFSNVSHL